MARSNRVLQTKAKKSGFIPSDTEQLEEGFEHMSSKVNKVREDVRDSAKEKMQLISETVPTLLLALSTGVPALSCLQPTQS